MRSTSVLFALSLVIVAPGIVAADASTGIDEDCIPSIDESLECRFPPLKDCEIAWRPYYPVGDLAMDCPRLEGPLHPVLRAWTETRAYAECVLGHVNEGRFAVQCPWPIVHRAFPVVDRAIDEIPGPVGSRLACEWGYLKQGSIVSACPPQVWDPFGPIRPDLPSDP